MSPDDRRALWSDEALRTFSHDPARVVREWAWWRLGATHDDAHVPFLIAALPRAAEADAEAILEALQEIAPRALDAESAATLAAYEHTQAVSGWRGRAARELLAAAGDAEAVARIVVRCRGGLADGIEWARLRALDPARCRSLLDEAGWRGDPSAAPMAALASVAWACEPEVLPRVHERAIAGRAEDGGEEVAAVVLERCRAAQAPRVKVGAHTRARGLVEELAATLAGRRSAGDRALAARWESAEALRGLADALVNRRWAEAAAWSRTRLDELRRQDDPSLTARAYAAWVARQRRPEEAMARTAITMALAAVDRALDALRPLDKADLETRAWRSLTASGPDVAARRAWAVAAWAEPEPRAALVTAVTQAFDSTDETLRLAAASLCEALPEMELPPSVTRGGSEALDRALRRCLAAHPASLDRLARVPEAGPLPSPLVYDALAQRVTRHASDRLREALGRLQDADDERFDALLDALERVGDPALLPPLLDAIDTVRDFAPTLNLLARLAPEAEMRSPEVVEALEAFEQDRSQAPGDAATRPFVVCFRCDDCGAEGRVEAPTCYIVDDLPKCRAEGWDGISFDRVITCAGCGAEDRYTLTLGTRLRLFLGLESHCDDHEMELTPLSIEGEEARRASELLRRFEARAAAAPTDLEARCALAVAQGTLGLAEAARATLEVALTLSSDNLCRLTERHDAVVAYGDEAMVEPSARAILAALPGSTAPEHDRKEAVRRAGKWLRAQGVVTLTWRAGDAEVTGALAFDRVTKWDRFVALLADGSVTKITPGGERPADGGTLEKAVEGIAPVATELRPTPARRAEPARVSAEAAKRYQGVGRNDPCPCGSGKKFKKCHLDKL